MHLRNRVAAPKNEPASDAAWILQALGNDDGLIRRRARMRLQQLGEKAVPLLIAAMSDHRRNARWEAAKVLAAAPDPRTTFALLSALSDEEPGVRWLAAEALAQIGQPALVPLLRRLVRTSGSVWFREGAHHILRNLAVGELGDSLSAVLQALEGISPEIGVLTPAVQALGRLESSPRIASTPLPSPRGTDAARSQNDKPQS